jgi:hypothetical protein
MKAFLFILFIPILSFADCGIELDEVQPLVKNELQPLHDKPNSSITKSDFIKAHEALSAIITELDTCAEFFHRRELENLHFEKWGEKSDRYRSYSMWLTSVNMQLEAAVDSFRYWILRSWIIDTDMWEKVANEFYAREI